MKGSCFESPQQQVDMHARSKNTFIVLLYGFIFTLFAQRLPNGSFFQTPSLRDANLLWLVDWSNFHLISPVMPDKLFESQLDLNVACTAL